MSHNCPPCEPHVHLERCVYQHQIRYKFLRLAHEKNVCDTLIYNIAYTSILIFTQSFTFSLLNRWKVFGVWQAYIYIPFRVCIFRPCSFYFCVLWLLLFPLKSSLHGFHPRADFLLREKRKINVKVATDELGERPWLQLFSSQIRLLWLILCLLERSLHRCDPLSDYNSVGKKSTTK